MVAIYRIGGGSGKDRDDVSDGNDDDEDDDYGVDDDGVDDYGVGW